MIWVSHEDGLTLITLGRPEKANALTADMLEALCIAVEESRDQKVIVLTGEGSVFCAGADLDAARAGLATSPMWERLSGAIARFQGLSIAALNGTCAGGALGMVLACDLRVCVPSTKFFYPVMQLGFLPQPSDPKRLAAIAGPSRARLMLMGGQKIGSEEALVWGLVDRIAEPAALMDTARILAKDTLEADLPHVRGIKSLF